MDTGPKDVAIVLRLLRAGVTLRVAGQRVGVSRSTAHRWARRFGMEAERRTQPRLSDETKSAIGRMRTRGCSIASVAVTLMVSRSSVRRYATNSPAPAALRCPCCGGLTHILPCPVCEARKLRRS
jgi:transposase